MIRSGFAILKLHGRRSRVHPVVSRKLDTNRVINKIIIVICTLLINLLERLLTIAIWSYCWQIRFPKSPPFSRSGLLLRASCQRMNPLKGDRILDLATVRATAKAIVGKSYCGGVDISFNIFSGQSKRFPATYQICSGSAMHSPLNRKPLMELPAPLASEHAWTTKA